MSTNGVVNGKSDGALHVPAKSAGPRHSIGGGQSHDLWSGFFRKTLAERRRQIKLVYPDLFPRRDGQEVARSGLEDDDSASLVLPEDEDDFPIDGLDPEIADNMIENCIGCLGIPLGLAVNFTINGRSLAIPMVTEEPSVIAAVSGAAKTMSTFGSPRGFVTDGPERNSIFAQIQLLDVPDSQMDAAVAKVRPRAGAKFPSSSLC